MALFRWLSGKPPQTELEQFCAKATMDSVARTFEAEPNTLGLAKSYALMLLHMGDRFLQGELKDGVVGSGPGQPRPNVVIFEVASFIWSIVQAPIMRWAEDEVGLDEDSEVCNNISASLGLAYGLMMHHWPGVDLDRLGRSRIYASRRLDDEAAGLADWIMSSAGSDVPATTRKRSLDVTQLPLTLSCVLFTKHMAPAVIETLKRQIAFLATGKL